MLNSSAICMHGTQVQSKAEEETIAQLEFAARAKLSALEQEAAQQATLSKMRDEVSAKPNRTACTLHTGDNRSVPQCGTANHQLLEGPSHALDSMSLLLRQHTHDACSQAQARAAELEAKKAAKMREWEMAEEARRLRAQVRLVHELSAVSIGSTALLVSNPAVAKTAFMPPAFLPQHEDARRRRLTQAAEDAAAQAAVRKELLAAQLAMEDQMMKVGRMGASTWSTWAFAAPALPGVRSRASKCACLSSLSCLALPWRRWMLSGGCESLQRSRPPSQLRWWRQRQQKLLPARLQTSRLWRCR